MVPGDNFLSLCLSLLFFLITKHDIHGYFFLSPSWLQRIQLLGPLLTRPRGGSDRRLALFTSVASRCNLVNHVANGRTPWVPTHWAPQWRLIHIEYNRVFKSFHALWWRLAFFVLHLQRGLYPLLLFQTGICSSSCLLQLDKERAGFFLFLFLTNELITMVWNVGWNGPSAPCMHILAFCYSNISQQDIWRGSRAHVPQLGHCVDNNLLNTKEK